MSTTKNLLIEIGTEELPPRSLKRLATAFHDEVINALTKENLGFSESSWYATPRRLVVSLTELQVAQEDKAQQRRGPALNVAYDEAGNPTRATEGFAKSCGVSVDQLETLETDKGSWLIVNTIVKGKQTAELIPEIIEIALKRLPIAKRMRWGDNDFEFVRPIKWIMVLFDNETIDCKIMGVSSGNHTRGHRFHHPDSIKIEGPISYLATLKETGKVIADFNERRTLIQTQAEDLAREQQGNAIIDPDLLDEVTALVEWPVAFVGKFDPDFLKLPEEVLIASMQDHQKYFPINDTNGKLLPCFIGIANIESPQAELIQQGNQRVIQPRLNDATFFWERDREHGLSQHIPALEKVVYQKQLGSLQDKAQRLITLVSALAETTGIDVDNACRAAELCLCDLLTEMVYEFPELQGTMGRYYAEAEGEAAEVAVALEEFYQPRFAGDELPSSAIGQCLAISEKIDSLVGIFAIGKAPTGDKDPFGLRRSAIGLLRIIIECELDIDLKELIQQSAACFPNSINAGQCVDEVYQFLQERLRRYYLDNGTLPDSFESVLAIDTSKPLDFHHRLTAVNEFRKLTEAESLAAANKRISNILKKSKTTVNENIDDSLLSEEAEKTLANTVQEYEQRLKPLLAERDYKSALTELAGLRDDVDHFFDNVMVMCDDDSVKMNRLAMLNRLSALFLETADISKLQA